GGRVFPGALLQASNGAVSQAVSKNKYAIGYIGLSYLNKEVKDLKVKGVRASKDTAAAYPVSRTLYMFTDGWPEGVTLQFMNWIMHPEKGQKVVENVGYVPLY
ncbi:MAG: phosphate ABC transporter substrate-binding protein, partial [Desulfobacterales bacterium]|nr:phosphate ABC transporter substrate-binding protein [Desulfobacterales bacterium]